MQRRVRFLGFAIGLFVAALVLSRVNIVRAQSQLPQLPTLPDLPLWFPPVWQQALSSPQPASTNPGSTPATIPQYFQDSDASGNVATYSPNGSTITEGNAYFTSLGSNGRTCFTCHQPQSGWAMNPSSAAKIFTATRGTDPLFSPVDGMNCPSLEADVTSISQKAAASSQLLTKGNIRIFLPVPSNAQYKVRILRDPYGCETSSRYGLPSGVISMYRRVLNATNLTRNAVAAPTPAPQGNIMWDGREPTLQSQFQDATLGHAQAKTPPSSAQINQGVSFETGLFTAQGYDSKAGSLSTFPAMGGPVFLSLLGAPNVPAPVPQFTQYEGWGVSLNPAQASIARGETVFNTKVFVVNGVAGFNDIANVFGLPLPGPVPLTCSACHNNFNVGSDTLGGPRHLGIGDNSSADKSGYQTTATALPPTSDQPLFAFDCPVGSIPFFSNPVTISGVNYDEFQTTDPGMGLITGNCADLGKFKVPRLSGLASRAPYFHNGNAATLKDLVNFYNTRFQIGLTPQQQQDLINFLNSL